MQSKTYKFTVRLNIPEGKSINIDMIKDGVILEQQVEFEGVTDSNKNYYSVLQALLDYELKLLKQFFIVDIEEL